MPNPYARRRSTAHHRNSYKASRGIISAEVASGAMHFEVRQKIKHQTTLAYVSPGGEGPRPLIMMWDKSILAKFRDGIKDRIDLTVHIGKTAYLDADVFHKCLYDDLIIKSEASNR